MEDNVTAIIAPIKCRIFNKENRTLYKIFHETDTSANRLIDKTLSLIEFIEDNEIMCLGLSKTPIIRMLSEGTKLSNDEIRIILQFLFGEKYVQIENKALTLTHEGKLLRIMNRSFLATAMFQYFWEYADWNSLNPSSDGNKFMTKDARDLIAMVIFKHSESYFEFKRNNSLELEEFLINPQFNVREIFLNEALKFIFKNIFEEMGLIELKISENDVIIKTSDIGERVFEYCSRELIEEYSKLTEECWESYDRGNFQQAFEMALSILAVNQENMEAYNVLGCVYIRQRDYCKAKMTFNYAIKLYEATHDLKINHRDSSYEPYISLNYNLGLCCFYQGDYMNSLKILNSIRSKINYAFESIEDIVTSIKKMIIIDKC